MNKKYLNQISALLLSSAVCAGTAGSMSSVVQAADYVVDGKVGEYRYQVYNMNTTGNVVFDAESDAFSCSFSNYKEAMYMLTKNFNEHSTEDYGKITIQYDVELNASDVTSGSIIFGINGWAEPDWSVAKLPANDFHIIDGWADWRPPGGNDILETVEIDGVLYDIYRTYLISGMTPGIHGTETEITPTYWSVRRENILDGKFSGRVKSTVTLSEHMKIWEKYGFDPSALDEAGFYIDGYQSGEFNVKVNSLDVTTDLDKEKTETKLPEENVKEPDAKLPEEDVKEPDAKIPEEDVKESEEKSDTCVLKGDCDNNGAVNTADFVVIKKYLLGIQEADINSDSLDMNDDGKINVADYIILRHMLLDLI